MTHVTRLAVLLVALGWLSLSPRNTALAAVLCLENVAVVQDNFNPDPNLDGWYCSPFQTSSEGICDIPNILCSEACNSCGGTLVSSQTCQWRRSTGAAPSDPTAAFLGCPANNFAEWFFMPCNCNFAPACVSEGGSCSGSGECCSGFCNGYGYCANESPLLIHLKSNSVDYRLTSSADGVLFDIDADGERDQVAWTSPGTPVGFIVLDRNGNGQIDNGSELFGEATRKRNGERARNGFDALLDLEGGPGAGDGQIDLDDESYSLLRVWVDANHDGVSQHDELHTLASVGITTVFMGYSDNNRTDQNGNVYRYVGDALVRQGGQETHRRFFDVYLKSERK